MQERRKELLEFIMKELNPKAYEVMVIEIGVELADIYSAMFDVQYEHYNRIGKPPKKAEAQVMNDHGLKSIEYGKSTADIILKKEDKYVYAQAIMNLYLSISRIYSKLYEKDDALNVKNLEASYRSYEWLHKFMKDYMKDKGI
jgi:KIF-1 binding protein C terminal